MRCELHDVNFAEFLLGFEQLQREFVQLCEVQISLWLGLCDCRIIGMEILNIKSFRFWDGGMETNACWGPELLECLCHHVGCETYYL